MDAKITWKNSDKKFYHFPVSPHKDLLKANLYNEWRISGRY